MVKIEICAFVSVFVTVLTGVVADLSPLGEWALASWS